MLYSHVQQEQLIFHFVQSFDNEHERRFEFWQDILSDQYICVEEEKTEYHLLIFCEKKY